MIEIAATAITKTAITMMLKRYLNFTITPCSKLVSYHDFPDHWILFKQNLCYKVLLQVLDIGGRGNDWT
jgi:hypothetical protein